MSDASVYGLIGLTEESVGLDRRIYTGLTSTDPTLAVSYNSGRVDVFLNGVKLVGNHSEMPSGTKDYTFTASGQGSSITLATGVALVASDVVEVMGYVSNSANTVETYSYTASDGDTQFTANNSSGDLVNVFLNGVLLDSSDYNLTTANTVTLGSGAAASDIVHIQVIGALDNSNFVPAGGGTFTGNVAYTGNIQVDDIVEKTSGHGVEIDGVTLKDGGGTFTGPITGVDVNGTELVLDADGDTSITADTDDKIDFKTGGTKRLEIDSSGNVELKTGNLTFTTGTQGINFANASDSASGSDNALLDDYEEGSVSNPLVIGGNTVTGGYDHARARYVKVGNTVTYSFYIDTSSNTTTGGTTGAVEVHLPFTALSSSGRMAIHVTNYVGGGWVTDHMWYFEHGFTKVMLKNTGQANISRTASNQRFWLAGTFSYITS